MHCQSLKKKSKISKIGPILWLWWTPSPPQAPVLFCWRHVLTAFMHPALIRSWEEKRKARKPVWSERTSGALRNYRDSPCNSLAAVSAETQPPCAARFWWWTHHRWSGRRASHWPRGWTARSGAPCRLNTVWEEGEMRSDSYCIKTCAVPRPNNMCGVERSGVEWRLL